MQDLTKIISAGVGPIIVISACGLLCLAFYNRMAAVVGRLRAFHREQLHEQQALERLEASRDPDEAELVRRREMLGMFKVQIDAVHRRARWIRRTISCLLYTIVCLAGCSLAAGLGVVWPPALYTAVPLFVIGLCLLIVGVIFALIELEQSLEPVGLEARFVSEMDG